MAELRVNPNRMELMKLRRRLETSRRGHKLLKDKLDELMKAFMERVMANRRLRGQVEIKLRDGYGLLAIARAQSGAASISSALLAGEAADLVEITTRNVMSVYVPEMKVADIPEPAGYSFALTPTVLDGAMDAMTEVLPMMLELAAREKAIELLAIEIEATRRRVNALEHVLIPQIAGAIRSIRMKLDESDRSDRTRLMKVKEMLAGD